MDETLWWIMEIVGPVILLIVLIWLVMRRALQPQQPTNRPRQVRATSTARKSSGGARGLTTSERDRPPAVVQQLVRSARAGSRAVTSSTCWSLRGAGRSALLVAATGAGKTLAGFLPTICELAEKPSRRPAHALRLAAEGAGGRRPAQPDRPDRGDGAADPRRDPHRRHAVRPQGAPAGEARRRCC